MRGSRRVNPPANQAASCILIPKIRRLRRAAKSESITTRKRDGLRCTVAHRSLLQHQPTGPASEIAGLMNRIRSTSYQIRFFYCRNTATTRRGEFRRSVQLFGLAPAFSSTARARLWSLRFNRLRRSAEARRASRALSFPPADTVSSCNLPDRFPVISHPESPRFRSSALSCIFPRRAARTATNCQRMGSPSLSTPIRKRARRRRCRKTSAP